MKARRSRDRVRLGAAALAVAVLAVGAPREPVAEAARGGLPGASSGGASPAAPAAASSGAAPSSSTSAIAAAPVAPSVDPTVPALPPGVRPVAPPLPLSIAIAAIDGKTAQTLAWVDAQIAAAQTLYNAFGVSFRKAGTRRLAARFAALENRADRDALATQLEPGVINVFVVASLRDVDDPRLYRMGVHWAPNGDLKRQYVIVSAAARKTTMAHEIGHFFTLQHRQIADNLMSYTRTGGEVFLDAVQKQAVIASVKSHVARRSLIP